MVACPVEAICQLLDLTPTSAWQLANLTNAILARNQSLKSSCILTRTINQLFDSSSIMKPMRAIACTTPETPHGVHKVSLYHSLYGVHPPTAWKVLKNVVSYRCMAIHYRCLSLKAQSSTVWKILTKGWYPTTIRQHCLRFTY
ncbi:hypothetical protein Fot_42592 [Forsythia ovata]|uniref:Reverse transcriptase n=1 Tax=Forsythia ovata TaxID=205694 RepID=A0ABD1RLL7_9LAMI